MDYFVELANLQQRVNTQELKVVFHDSLRAYSANYSNNETSTNGALRMGIFTIDPKYTDFVGALLLFTQCLFLNFLPFFSAVYYLYVHLSSPQ